MVKPFVFERPGQPLGHHCTELEAYVQQYPHPVKNLEPEGFGIVARGCNNYHNKTDTVREPAKTQTKKKVKAVNRQEVKYSIMPVLTRRLKRECELLPRRLTSTRWTAFPERGTVLLFKNMNYQVSLSIGLK